MISNTTSRLQPKAPSAEQQKAPATKIRIRRSALQGNRQGAARNDADTFRRTQETAPLSPSGPRLSMAERKAMMRQHIDEGIDLIKNGEYEQAIEHFQSHQQLAAMKVGMDSPFCFIRHGLPTSVEDAKWLVNQAARINMANHDQNAFSIKFARVLFVDRETGEAPQPKPGTSEAAILNYINYEQALMAAEENIHTYQNMNDGKNMTYHPAAGQETEHDYEIDIATTLERYGLTLTHDFLKRYKDRARHVQAGEAFDLREVAPGQVEWVSVPIDKSAR